MIEIIVIIGLFFAGVIYLLEVGKSAGKDSLKSDSYAEVIDDIHTAKQARDRLKHDAYYAKRVRDRFTRKDVL